MGKHEAQGNSSIRRSTGGSHAAPKHSAPSRRADSSVSSRTETKHSSRGDSRETRLREQQPEEVRPTARRSVTPTKQPRFQENIYFEEATVEARDTTAGRHSQEAIQKPASESRRDSQPREARRAGSHTAAPRRAEDIGRRIEKAEYIPLQRETGRRNSATKKRKPDKKRDPLLTGVSIALVCVMLFAGFKLASTIANYKKNRDAYSALNDSAVVRFTPKPAEAVTEETEELTVEEEPVSEVPISVDWEILQQTNSDIVAWLYCPDTIISYPIVQSVDNDYYLTHDFYRDERSAGALFADKDSVVGLSASHLIVYGHNMKDNSMFGTLKGYATAEYYTEHPIFYLLTPSQNYRIELVQAQTIDASIDNYPTYFSTESDKISYIDHLSSTAYWLNTDNIHSDLQLITFSTCTSSDDERFIVQGTLIPVD